MDTLWEVGVLVTACWGSVSTRRQLIAHQQPLRGKLLGYSSVCLSWAGVQCCTSVLLCYYNRSNAKGV
jgi:hypothetical protein